MEPKETNPEEVIVERPEEVIEHSPVEGNIEEFSGRFDALLKEAYGYGIRGVVLLTAEQPLTRSESRQIMWAAGDIIATGLCQSAADYFSQRARGYR